MCEMNEELLWQLKQERKNNTSLINELARYRTELALTRNELISARSTVKRLEGTPDVSTFH